MDSSRALLTSDQVEKWVAERADVARRHAELSALLADLDRKLEAVSFLLPTAKAEALLHPEKVKPRTEMTFAELALEVLGSADRGFTPADVRNILKADPEVGKRTWESANGVTNALSRLALKDEVVKQQGRYYLTETHRRIVAGEIDEQLANDDVISFNSAMHAAMKSLGRPFTAADAQSEAQRHPDLAAKLSEQPSRVYSWLSREAFRHKLIKVGSYYSYPPNENGALPTESASAPEAGEGATSSTSDQSVLRLIG